MTAPERLRRNDGAADGGRFDGTFRWRARIVAGSARARLTPGRPRAPSRGIREEHRVLSSSSARRSRPEGSDRVECCDRARVVVCRQHMPYSESAHPLFRMQACSAEGCAAAFGCQFSIPSELAETHSLNPQTVCLCFFTHRDLPLSPLSLRAKPQPRTRIKSR